MASGPAGNMPVDLNCLTIEELEKHAAVRMDKQTRDYYNEVSFVSSLSHRRHLILTSSPRAPTRAALSARTSLPFKNTVSALAFSAMSPTSTRQSPSSTQSPRSQWAWHRRRCSDSPTRMVSSPPHVPAPLSTSQWVFPPLPPRRSKMWPRLPATLPTRTCCNCTSSRSASTAAS